MVGQGKSAIMVTSPRIKFHFSERNPRGYHRNGGGPGTGPLRACPWDSTVVRYAKRNPVGKSVPASETFHGNGFPASETFHGNGFPFGLVTRCCL